MKETRLLNIGYGNFVSINKIVAILKPGSSPIRRLIHAAKGEGRLLDATTGKKTRSVIVTDSGFIILSAVLPETLSEKLNMQHKEEKEDASKE